MKKILKYLIILGILQSNSNASSEPPTAHSVDLNSTVSLDMIWCPPGTFTMGSPITEAGRQSEREDEHDVTLTKGFYLGKYEVTQAQYEAVMTGNTNRLSATPSHWGNNPDRPVEKVSWNDAQVFVARLNEQQSANIPTGWAYVLPTESQWEYACRAGTKTIYSWGNTITSSNVNYNASGINQTSDVGQYAANPWGFFDMHGNVWEWTADWYQATYPTGNPVIDPTGPTSGSKRTHRGGSWVDDGSHLRSAKRGSNGSPDRRTLQIGFRIGFQKVTDEKSAPEPPRSTLKDGLIGHWTFDESEGSIAHDASGNENHGQLHNGPTWTTGKIGGALNFDGVNDRLKMPNLLLNGKIDLSYVLWFKMTLGSNNTHGFASGANPVDANRYQLGIMASGEVFVNDPNLLTHPHQTKQTWSDNWNHFVFKRNNNGLSIYINGKQVKEFSYSTTALEISNDGFWIGADQDSVGGGWEKNQYLEGALDDVRIYDRALSTNEIKELYELGNKSSKPAPDATPPKTGPGDAPDLKCKETIGKLEQEIKNQKIEITDLNTLIIELRKQVADLNSSNLALTTEVSGLKNQVNNLNGQVASLTSENGELKGQVTNLREDNGNLQSNITSLNEQLVESDRIAKTPFVHDWVYTPDHGWLYIDPKNFPIIYKNDSQTWHFYEQGSINPRYFYNFKEQKWEAWDPTE